MRVRVDVTYGQVLAVRATELEDDLATVAGYLAQVRAELRHHRRLRRTSPPVSSPGLTGLSWDTLGQYEGRRGALDDS